MLDFNVQKEQALWHVNLTQWRSRRGLLELDLIFVPFFEKHYHDLTITEKQQHQWFLMQKDTDLQSWFVLRSGLESLSAQQKNWVNTVLNAMHNQ